MILSKRSGCVGQRKKIDLKAAAGIFPVTHPMERDELVIEEFSDGGRIPL